MPRALFALLVSTLGGGTPSHHATHGPPETGLCQPCHQKIVATFIQTAHFRTSAEATPRSVEARFSEGHNVLPTGAEGIYFRMERRNGVFYQVGVDSGRGTSRAERMDLVIGSGRRGQSYLYWRNGLLFELPVSYLTGIGRWINSPGYPDGQIDFGRLIVPRCLECHSTSFTLQVDRRALRYSRPYVLGLSCEKCHGDGRAHVRYQSAHPADTAAKYILNPARFSRDRKVDHCALCHSGERDPRQPPFTYRPGDNLDDYFLPPPKGEVPVPDVHGNQVALLRRSKCFRTSPDMSCSTCHDVHEPQRDVAWFAQKCLGCHETHQHRLAEQLGERLTAWCIDCHMPERKSKAIEINTPTTRVALRFRSHAIGIYPDVAAAVLRSHGVEPPR
jgi:predicted CXXCH cytochrome family protein